jgi:hypothetical protein
VRAAAAILLACLLAGCGSQSTATLHAWDVEPPYLPPRDPSYLPTTTPAKPSSPARKGREIAPGAPSDAEVAQQLREAYGGEAGTDLDRAAIDGAGLATIPATAPKRLVALMRAANQVAFKPYVYGGGHGRNPDEIWQDSAYDCSGSVSFALASAGYLQGPTDSSGLARFGKPGPGKWVTIYANAGHAFMVVAGLRFDTSGRQSTGSRWQPAPRTVSGFTVRHPPGL